ncbi:cellulose binding domain-containing protein [Actinoplanes derwentensis]|uniref:Cellulose binding domain-containing protein n=1 Tax=Actinoplanes derwentensis TaxID=113562 RepID=A0A1H2D8A7_9ACTN|nr:cellulose binding domain-containing protein [Actinoplanes derwentensis]GID86350.1 hypothetical protein Ade03nite_52740 [Actinoplanes derwentensis]SDT78988.1 Cellulose binding domain-containing protein [Actinoplanes derwentensis]
MRQPRRTTIRPALAGLLGLATIAATGLSTPAAVAAPAAIGGAAASRPSVSVLDRIPAPARERMLAQTPLVDAASVIRTAVQAGPPRGYAGLGLVGGHVTLWWKGTPPADIATAVATARHIAPVTVERAAYSAGQLKAGAARLDKAVGADTTDAAHGVRIRTDGSGLDVLVDKSASAEVPDLPEVGVPARTVRQQPMRQRSTRHDDSAPWSGGTSIWALHTGALCTSGFGVRDLATDSPLLITAGHCGDLGTEWADRTGEIIGTTVSRNADHDAEVIATTSAGNTVYVGNATDGVQARVAGWTEVFPGQLLCQSGNTSAEEIGGPVCNLQVQFHYTDREDLVEATQLDGDEAARSGDSGGPVYAVTAQGTLLAAGTTTRSGGAGFGFQDFATYRTDFGDLVPVTEGSTGTCRVSYQITDRWADGYTANVTVYNSGADITGWSLAWDLPTPGQIQGRWNAVVSQSGTTVTATNESYNARITSGGAVNFGFTASGSPATPAPVTLNGAACA